MIHQALENNEQKLIANDNEFKWLDLDPLKNTYHYINKKGGGSHRMHTESSLKKLRVSNKLSRDDKFLMGYKNVPKRRSRSNFAMDQLSFAMQALNAISIESSAGREKTAVKFKENNNWLNNDLHLVNRKMMDVADSSQGSLTGTVRASNMSVLNLSIEDHVKIDNRNEEAVEIFEIPPDKCLSSLRNENEYLMERLGKLETQMNQLRISENEGAFENVLDIVEKSLMSFNKMLDDWKSGKKRKKSKRQSKQINS